MTLMQELYLLRRKKGIRIIDLSEAIEVSPGWISRFETGQIEMNRELQVKYKNFIENY